ncbi:MAG: FkbM family methyltransferase [Candidatus Omnitrophica bacterium]|nr:FkbM family methyltransferase [Candidatus Omnitrophota bacterium]MDD5653127.1 FkbM family methyltransferase [Candidatus Omnitrophota bacterium]
MKKFSLAELRLLKKIALKIPGAYKCFIYAENQLRYFFRKNKILSFYANFINKGDLCFDIGANVGSKTKIFLELGAQVVAVEPQDYCMQQLQKQFEKNNKVKLVKMACGEKLGTTELMLCDNYRSSSISKEWINIMKNSRRFSVFNWRGREKVHIITLDELIRNYGKPTFCKIDVEGYELEVIKGLSKPVKYMSFEFNSECVDIALNCIQYLFGIGVRNFNYSIDETMELVSPEWFNIEEIRKALLSLPKGISMGDIYTKLDN